MAQVQHLGQYHRDPGKGNEVGKMPSAGITEEDQRRFKEVTDLRTGVHGGYHEETGEEDGGGTSNTKEVCH